MRTKIRAYRKTNFVLIRKFTDYLHRFFIVSKGGAMEEFTKELLDQLNVDTAFTIGPFAISESVVITWVVMAILVLLSAWLTRGLKVHNPGKKQIVAESIVIWLDKFTISMLGENAKEYSTYISTILLSFLSLISDNTGKTAVEFHVSCLATHVMLHSTNHFQRLLITH